MQMPHASFAYLVDPANQVCLLLSTHWVALKKIMKTITDAERRASASPRSPDEKGDPDLGITRWLGYLNRQIDAGHRRHNRWPLWVEARLDADPMFFAKP